MLASFFFSILPDGVEAFVKEKCCRNCGILLFFFFFANVANLWGNEETVLPVFMGISPRM